MAGAGDRRLARVQSASVAVTGTVVAIVAMVGLSAAVVYRSPRAPVTAVAAGSVGDVTDSDAGTASDGPAGTPSAKRDKNTDSRRRVGRIPSDRSEASPTAPNGDGPGIAPAIGTEGVVGASGKGGRAGAERIHLVLAPAEAGTWSARARVEGDETLLGRDHWDETVEVVVEPAEHGAQRIGMSRGWLSLMSEVVRYDDEGRWGEAFEIATSTDEVLQFEAAGKPSLLLPVTTAIQDPWTWALATADRRTSLDVTETVLATGRLTIGDRAVDVVEYQLDAVLGGDRSMTITRRTWFSPELGLPVRVQERTAGTNPAGQTIDRTVVVELTAGEPMGSDDPEQAPPPSSAPPSTAPPATTTTTTTTAPAGEPD